MSDESLIVTTILLAVALVITYAVYMQQAIARTKARAERRGAMRMREQVIAMLNKHAEVSPPSYQTVYASLAQRAQELPLDSDGIEWRRQ